MEKKLKCPKCGNIRDFDVWAITKAIYSNVLGVKEVSKLDVEILEDKRVTCCSCKHSEHFSAFVVERL